MRQKVKGMPNVEEKLLAGVPFVRYHAQRRSQRRGETMDVFVTGGTGFVGSHVVDRLIEVGHEPLCLVRETSDTEHLEEIGAEAYVGSLGDVEGLRAAVEEVDAVVHIAGVIKVREPREFYEINGESTAELVKMTADAAPDLDRFVYISSIAARGPGFDPDETGTNGEPVSHYGRSKLLGDKGVRGVADELPVTIFRPPPVYGPRDHEMFKLFQGAKYRVAPMYGRGEGRTSVIHVFDLARAVERRLEVDHETGSIFHIDDGDHYTQAELVEICGDVLGTCPLKVPVPGVLFKVAASVNETVASLRGEAAIFTRDKVAEMEKDAWVCGNRRLRDKLGWEPEWSIEEGTEQTAEWYREHDWI
jgi:nucleoside-diphosphate-sugar epimerase